MGQAVRSSCAVELRGRAALPSFVLPICAAQRTGWRSSSRTRYQTTSSRTEADNLLVDNLADNLAHNLALELLQAPSAQPSIVQGRVPPGSAPASALFKEAICRRRQGVFLAPQTLDVAANLLSRGR